MAEHTSKSYSTKCETLMMTEHTSNSYSTKGEKLLMTEHTSNSYSTKREALMMTEQTTRAQQMMFPLLWGRGTWGLKVKRPFWNRWCLEQLKVDQKNGSNNRFPKAIIGSGMQGTQLRP